MTTVGASPGTAPARRGPAILDYFVVLPDRPVAAPALDGAARCVPHLSGRPWIVGNWDDTECTLAATGAVRVAVLGRCRVSPAELAARFAGMTSVDDLDRLARGLAGSFHLVASVGGTVVIRGTASGLRRVFYGRLGPTVVAADRADTVAELTGAGVDEESLALRLLQYIPHPLAGIPVWRGVRQVPPSHQLVLDRDGGTEQLRRWWSPPEPDLSLARGAGVLRAALEEAVAARTDTEVSCDLSGGLDSTSICFLAARQRPDLVAVTAANRDTADDDLYWAHLALEHLPEVGHEVVPAGSLPLFYAGATALEYHLDEPTAAIVDQTRRDGCLYPAIARGSRRHLDGGGGDHLLWGTPLHVRDLLRRRPRLALARLRGYRAMFRWSVGATVKALFDSRPYGAWLADAAAHLTAPLPPSHTPYLSWDYPPRLPDWASGSAVDAVRRQLRDAAGWAEPLGPTRGAHEQIQMLWEGTQMGRLCHLMGARLGIRGEAPFFDDQVVEACLRVPLEERFSPWEYKPLLKSALRGIMPDASLRRITKGSGSLDFELGHRHHRDELLALCDDSLLAEAGLIDVDRLRAFLDRPDGTAAEFSRFDSTVAAEVWLRTRAALRPDGLIWRT